MKLIIILVLILIIFCILGLCKNKKLVRESYDSHPPAQTKIGTLKKIHITIDNITYRDIIHNIKYELADMIMNIDKNSSNSLICNINISSGEKVTSKKKTNLPNSCSVCDLPITNTLSDSGDDAYIYEYIYNIKTLHTKDFEEYRKLFEEIDFTDKDVDMSPSPTSRDNNYTCNLKWEGDECPYLMFYLEKADKTIQNKQNYNIYFIINQDNKLIHDHILCYIDQRNIVRNNFRCDESDLDSFKKFLNSYIQGKFKENLGYIKTDTYYNPNLELKKDTYHITKNMNKCYYYPEDNYEKQLIIYNKFKDDILKDIYSKDYETISDTLINMIDNANKEELYNIKILLCMLGGYSELNCGSKNFTNPYSINHSILYHPNPCCFQAQKKSFKNDICKDVKSGTPLEEACSLVENPPTILSQAPSPDFIVDDCHSLIPKEGINLKDYNQEICNKVLSNIGESEDQYDKYYNTECPSMEEGKECNKYCDYSMSDIFQCNYEYFTGSNKEDFMGSIQENFACIDKKIDEKTPFIDDDTDPAGKTCLKHETDGLCKDGKWLDESITPKTNNDPEMSAKDACCVCGGGNEVPEDNKTDDKLLGQKLLELSDSNSILMQIEILTDLETQLSNPKNKYKLEDIITEEIQITTNLKSYYDTMMKFLKSTNIEDENMIKIISQIIIKVKQLVALLEAEPQIENIRVKDTLKTKITQIKNIITNKTEANLGILELDIQRNNLISEYLTSLSPT